MPDENSPLAPALPQYPPATLSRHFDSRVAATFCERSVSEETRRAYRRVVKEFFAFYRRKEPAELTPADMQRWRDHLIERKRSASTVSFKLSVVRSLFDYLLAGGYVSSNPALTKLVPPPALPEDLRGRALSPKEVRYLLSGPDRNVSRPKHHTLLLPI